MVNQINSERSCHIITIEDPIEYLHTHKFSIINQRELGAGHQIVLRQPCAPLCVKTPM
jgi:Tfp pilus assembly pilus retraction ATPase PilT